MARIEGICLMTVILWTVAYAQDGSGQSASTDPFSLNSDIGSGEGEIYTQEISTCTPEFAAEVDHTMCLVDDDRVISYGVTEEEKKIIVDYHNEVRRNVQPPATDLTKLIWDDNLAAVAQKLTMQCKIEHDKNRNIPSYGEFIGQNLAAGQLNWKGAMEGWFNEVKLYLYGEDADQYLGPGRWKEIGHYTQMVNNRTHRIGCGFAQCSETRYGFYYACNYATGQSSTRYPYTLGDQCSACPSSCKNGLCECNGKLCLNQGKLDLDTCTCICPYLYQGEDCSILRCPEKDPFYCTRSIVPRDCVTYINVPHLCPYMCGVCSELSSPMEMISGSATKTKTTTTTTTTPSPYFVSPHNCTYTGLRATAEECKTYGDHGSDSTLCESKKGQLRCADCQHFYNVKFDYCPVMCGICDAPCEGKICANGGTLDTENCSCTCRGPFQGETCNKLVCPKKDPWGCRFFSKNECQIYANVPYDCPYFCGICS
ncbi:cysteine-rich venom protein [Plakobranchus ocellatus]|uniref:Cysteine-rich venom protein n=1 Tax=Plakobranchus ocellatus TaxID=259542 RepID=A0AAV4CNR7_9GAST|nr:cysteine-rich venom protein [Plakobranchus ocellatus]